jgi:hypothetical protein
VILECKAFLSLSLSFSHPKLLISRSNLSLLDVPIRIALRLVPRPRARTFLRQLIKLVITLLLFARSRKFLILVGLHTE